MPCLDTCVIVDLLGRDRALSSRAGAKLREIDAAGKALCVSRFTWAELCVGVYRSQDPAAEEAAIHGVLDSLPILEFDDKATRLFGTVTAQLLRAGRPIGDLDVLIASTALAAGQSVVTRDVEHFSRILGLVVETY